MILSSSFLPLLLGVTLLVLTIQGSLSQQTDCQSRINHHRTKYGISPLITERTDLHTCVNRQSQYDKYMGAHRSYRRCGSLGSQGSGGGSNCANVIDAFFNERWRCTDNMSIFASSIASSDPGSLRNCRQNCMNDASCLSFDYDADAASGQSCRFYDVASGTHVRLMDDGMYWMGFPESVNVNPPGVDTWESFSIVEIDGSNTIPADGQVTQIKWYGKNSNAVDFFMYRHRDDISDDTYEVIGKAQATSTNVNVENTLNVNPPIQVQKGDVLGFTWIGAAAIGYTENNEGQIRYKHEENSGGPSNVGDTWEFDRTLGRKYHVAASFVPTNPVTTTTPSNYCAAAKCQGHCGPVMGSNTHTFAWGVYEGHYTLNWRPGPTIPAGNDCPSGIGVVKCWTDPNTDILWAYGVGGEDCHSTCSLAGAQPSSFMCDENAPITGGLDEVSQIMSNFENPHNDNDDGPFTCTSGTCWSGNSNKQILIHEYNSDCYVPENTNTYTCDSRIGNGNCYGQRFNQVCPCIPGCSWAAGPSCTPNSAPTPSPTSVPTSAPAGTTPSPTSSPTPAPTPDTGHCLEDSRLRFFLRKDKQGNPIYKKCRWLQKLPNTRKNKICNNNTNSNGGFGPAKDVCKVTCDTCSSDCTEIITDKFHFKIRQRDNKALRRSCNWLAKKSSQQVTNICTNKTDSHQGLGPAKDVCPITCDTCAR